MNLAESLFIRGRSRCSLNMSNELRGIFVACLSEVNLVANPQGGPFFSITSIQIIRRVDELSGGKSGFRSP
jgi:hypothetical protein